MNRIVIMGPPGAGKGTQGAVLAAALGVPHITTGGLFRDEVTRGTPLGAKVAQILQSGRYVDDVLATTLLKGRLERQDAGVGFILDGYPRTIEQAESLDALLEATNKKVDLVVVLDADEATLLNRLSNRSEDRADDRPEVIRERLARYHEVTNPVAEHYNARGLLQRVDGARSAKLVGEAIIAAILVAPAAVPTGESHHVLHKNDERRGSEPSPHDVPFPSVTGTLDQAVDVQISTSPWEGWWSITEPSQPR
ncbi:adenylate kinase [Agreia sp. PsM10]|uniref:adenylate kinase n=1 Tax=Agreia sp. PsM10 TaxID=3030533 RepID=UPI00263BAC82|nr:adenylate kinase [Agreia sp. PsM10]MDN4640066.1 adenylate kinase [Agreia sp. PsM10]